MQSLSDGCGKISRTLFGVSLPQSVHAIELCLIGSFATTLCFFELPVTFLGNFGLKAHFLRKHLCSLRRFYNVLAKRDFQSEIALKYRSRFKKNHNKLFTFLEYDGVPSLFSCLRISYLKPRRKPKNN